MMQVRWDLWKSQGRRCAHCGASLELVRTELAHRIPQTKGNLRKYGPEIIHHKMNMALVCLRSDRCNSGMDIRNHPMEIAELVDRINRDIEGQGGEREHREWAQ